VGAFFTPVTYCAQKVGISIQAQYAMQKHAQLCMAANVDIVLLLHSDLT